MRKSTTVISSLLMAGLISFAPAAPVLAADPANSGVYNLEKVIEKTKTGSSVLNLYSKKIDAAIAAQQDSTLPKLNETPYQTAMRLQVNPKRRAQEVTDLENKKKDKENTLVNQSIQYYYQCLIDDKLIQIQQGKIQRLTKAIEDEKTQISVGTKPENSLIDDEVNLSNAETDLGQMQNEIKNIKMKLNINMGSDVASDVVLEAVDVPYSEFTTADINKLANSMGDTYHTLQSMKQELALDNDERDIAILYDNGENQLKRAAYPNTDYKSYAETLSDTATDLEYAIIDESRNIKAKVLTDYNNILSLDNTVQSKKLDYEEAQILYNTEKSKLDVGMSTESACQAAEENMKLAQCEYEKAEVDYYISIENFKDYVDGYL